MRRYEKAKRSLYREEMDEGRDCAVIAVSILARVTYRVAHDVCAQHNRARREGMYTRDTIDALESLGFRVEVVNDLRQKNGSKYTQKTIGNKLKRGYHLCRHNGHVFAVVNGDVEDWSEGRKYHIKKAWKITRIKPKV